MESSIEFLAAIAFFIIGVSHIAQPRTWTKIFILLHSHGSVGVFATVLITLPLGLFIISFHNVWTGLPTVLTVIGWGMCAKCFLYLVYPRAGLAALGRVTPEKSNHFIIAGILMLGLSVLCGYSWYLNQS